MKGLKFLFRRGFRHIVLNIISLAIIAGLMAAVVLAHEPAGSEEYLMCKIGAHLGVMLSLILNPVFLCSEVTGNRLMRSAPFSKQLRCFSVPMYCIILGCGGVLFIDAFYAIFCVVSGLDMSHLSDMLIVSAPLMACYVVMGTVAMNMNYGMLIVIYTTFPISIMIFLMSGNSQDYGFGLPLQGSALIFAGALIVSIVAAFAIARAFYAKSDFKPLPQAAIYAK